MEHKKEHIDSIERPMIYVPKYTVGQLAEGQHHDVKIWRSALRHGGSNRIKEYCWVSSI